MDKIYAIIPSYDPDIAIMEAFIVELRRTFDNIIIVNDGSNSKYDAFFEAYKRDGIVVLNHKVNQGKGRAMKSAFNYLLDHHPDFEACVSADCDGQHAVKDIKNVGLLARKNPNNLILGVRDFDHGDVPAKSRFGNKMTRGVFKIFIGLDITDTQTGLRGFSKKMCEVFLGVIGERYEFESNMLIECKNMDITIQETTIDTIYINKNQTSHFNPIRDSLMIYRLFLKYIVASVGSFVLDISLFQVFMILLKGSRAILIATALARIISATFNYTLNGKFIFKNSNDTSIYKYFALALMIMVMSGVSVNFLVTVLHFKALFAKLLVDILLFIVSFVAQREWVFK